MLIYLEANRCKVMGYVPWHFAIPSEAAVQTDPFEEEPFIGPSDSELDDGHVTSMVRESVQHAQDARVGVAPVWVTFDLPESRVPQRNTLRYLAGLKPHLADLVPPVSWPLNGANDTIQGLVYEHFETTGPCGDPAIVDDSSVGHEHHEKFYWFCRNVGRSAKTCKEHRGWYDIRVKANSRGITLGGRARTLLRDASRVNATALTVRHAYVKCIK